MNTDLQVKMLRSLSHHFADIENNTEGQPWGNSTQQRVGMLSQG